MTTQYAVCDLTKRCRAHVPCRHHASDCEHKASWEVEDEKRGAQMDEHAVEIDNLKVILDKMLAMSWAARDRTLRFLWDRFLTHPRCSDDPMMEDASHD